MCWSATRIRPWSAAVNSAGLRIEGPVEQFTAQPCPPCCPPTCRTRSTGPVLVAVKAHHTAAAAAVLAGRLIGDGFVGLAPERADRAGTRRRARPGAGRRGVRQLRRGRARARRRPARQPGHVHDRRAGRDGQRPGVARWPRTSPTPSPRPASSATPGPRKPTARRCSPPQSATCRSTRCSTIRPTARCCWPWPREVLAQAPVRPLPLDGFDPADLEGSLARLADFNRRRPRPTPAIYRDLAIRHRPTEVRRDPRPARRLPAAPDRASSSRRSSEASGPAAGRTWTCWPPTSGWTGSAGR